MSSAMLTASWFPLGRDIYFRKIDIYSMRWQREINNLQNVLVVAAPYGGPVAVRRLEHKQAKHQDCEYATISLYTASGIPICPSIKWTRRLIVRFGWTNDEKLICVQNDGLAVVYDVFGNFLEEFSICPSSKTVQDAIIFTNKANEAGIAVRTSDDKIFVMESFSSGTPAIPKEFATPTRSQLRTTSWVVLTNHSTQILLAKEKELYRIKPNGISKVLEVDVTKPANISILHMAVSINSKHIVFSTNSGTLWLGSTELNQKYCEMDTGIIFPPNELVWCGNEAVVAFWEQKYTLMVVGRDGEKCTFNYDSMVHLVSEIDSIRVLSSAQHELIQKVPDVVQKIFKINSTDPGCFLLEASKQFQKHSHRSNEYLNLVKANLSTAVEGCIEAAGYEYNPEIQKMLIRAAQFGKCFVNAMNPNSYVRMIRVLRVLNAVRDRKIGIPLTITQMQYLTEKGLLLKLEQRRHYYLAIYIAKYLRMSEEDGRSQILLHWAKYKVSRIEVKDEEQVAIDIADKLGYSSSSISYSAIAHVAADCGKRRVAIKLLDYEPLPAKQVKLLQKLEEQDPALKKAIESGDTDLIYQVILHLHDNMSHNDFNLIIRKYETAQALYIKYCKQYDTAASTRILEEGDKFNAQAEEKLSLIFPLHEKKIYDGDRYLLDARDAYRKGRLDFGYQMCDDALRLFKQQRSWQEKYPGVSFLGKSVHDTCSQLLQLDEIKLAEKFRSDYKIPDKRYWWLRIECMADKNQWDELDRFSKSKKSPVGYAPFVDVCLARGQETEAAKYLSRVSDDLKVKYYIKAKRMPEAIQIAYEQRDVPGLLQILARTPANSPDGDRINNLLAQLGNKR